MKKIIFSLLLVSSLQLSIAQPDFMVTTGIGYNASFMNSKVFDSIVDYYNVSRPWLSKELNHLKYMHGFAWNGSATRGVFLIDLNFLGRSTVLSSQGEQDGEMFQRDIKVQNGSFGLGLGLNIIKLPPFTFGLGFDAEIGAIKFKKRMYPVNTIGKPDYEDIHNILSSGGNVWIQCMLYAPIFDDEDNGLGIAIRPYYRFDFLPYNFESVDENINAIPYPNTKNGNLNHFGVEVVLNVVFSE